MRGGVPLTILTALGLVRRHHAQLEGSPAAGGCPVCKKPLGVAPDSLAGTPAAVPFCCLDRSCRKSFSTAQVPHTVVAASQKSNPRGMPSYRSWYQPSAPD